MTIVLLDEAQDRFKAEDSWWREHRDARELFVTEFQDMVRQVAAAPGIGQRYRRARGKLIQRVQHGRRVGDHPVCRVAFGRWR